MVVVCEGVGEGQTHTLIDVATYRLNQPRGWLSQQFMVNLPCVLHAIARAKTNELKNFIFVQEL